MSSVHGAVPATVARPRRTTLVFLRHYLEMVLAMFLGMALYPLWTMATNGAAPDSVLQRVEVESLAMATAMSVPMVAWMVWRRHRPGLTVEMVAAMVAGFVVLFPFLWAGVLSDSGVMMTGHVLMPLFMLGAMLLRRREYVGHH